MPILCKRCGRELTAAVKWCPDCGTPVGQTVPCRACGKEIARWQWGRGCHHCGAGSLAAYGPIVILPPFLFLLVGLVIMALIWYFEIRPRELEFERVKQNIQKGHP